MVFITIDQVFLIFFSPLFVNLKFVFSLFVSEIAGLDRFMVLDNLYSLTVFNVSEWQLNAHSQGYNDMMPIVDPFHEGKKIVLYGLLG